jgi:threonine/homoserine/homoserine lactone efflux protein
MMPSPILTFFFQGAAIGITAAASPGPYQTFLISQSLAGGFRRAAPVAFAPLITDLPIILFSLFLLDQMPPYFLRLISLAGGLFVLYLAWGLWKSWRAGPDFINDAQAPSAGGSLGRGVLANFLSPGPYLFWALVNGPILLTALRQSTHYGIAFLVGFYGVMIASLLGIAFFFAQARRLGPGVVRALILASAIILVVFAGLLFKQAIWPAQVTGI